MPYQYITLSTQNAITILTLQRGDKCNALNGLFIHEILDAIKTVEEDPHTKILILKGAGKHFCAGADIQWLQQLVTHTGSEDIDALAQILYHLFHFSKPTIALAQGAIRGGGIGLLAACDIVFAAKESTFAFSEVKIGLIPSVISPYVVAAVGERLARYYFLTGETFNAEAAQGFGLIHHIVETEATTQDHILLDAGLEQAMKLIKNSPYAMQEAKKLIQQVAKEPITQALVKTTVEHLCRMQTTHEAREGLKAFMEKRSPNWTHEGK